MVKWTQKGSFYYSWHSCSLGDREGFIRLAYRTGDWVVQKWPSPAGEAEDLAASQFKELDGDGWARGTGDAFSIQGSRPRSALESHSFESFWETQEAGIWCPWKVTWQWTNSLGRGHVLGMTPLLPLVFSTHPPACWMVLYIFRAIPMLPHVSVISGNAHKGMLLVC